MADDLIELGIEGVDKLVDKHFHKIPDKYTHSDAYHMPHLHHHDQRHNDTRREEGRRRADSEASHEPRYQEDPRRRMYAPSDDDRYGYGYYQPPSPSYPDERGRRRPNGPVRRTSSQPGQYRDYRGYSPYNKRERRRRSLSDDRGKNSGRGEGHKYGKVETAVMAVLGVAAGGLAASAIISGIDGAGRTKKNRRAAEERKLEEKRVGDSRRLDDGGRGGGRSSRDQRPVGRDTRGGGRR